MSGSGGPGLPGIPGIPGDSVGSGDEETLDLGREPRGIPSGLIGMLSVLAVVIAGGVWLATRGSSPPPAGSSTPTEVLTLPGFATASVPPATASGASKAAREPTKCPGSIECDSVSGIPAHMLAVLREYVPAARGQSGYTVLRTGSSATHDDGLWYRQLKAHAGTLTVTIIVNRRFPPGNHDGHPSVIDQVVDGFSFGYVRLRVRGYAVQVQADGDRGERPSVEKLEQLAADPRLETLP